jgi:hypothetical protein
VSLPPRLRGLIWSTTKPEHAPCTDLVAGHGFFVRNARTGAGLREMRPPKSRTQFMHEGGCRVLGSGNLGAVMIWAFTMAQNASASVPIRNRRGCFEGIARLNARCLPQPYQLLCFMKTSLVLSASSCHKARSGWTSNSSTRNLTTSSNAILPVGK